jgi:hypothetical protein
MTTLIEAARQALEALETCMYPQQKQIQALTSLRQAIEQAEKQEPWVWMPAPIKTQWGHDMVVADLAIDKDHTVSVYCERDQTEKVEAMFRGTNT